MPEQNYQYYPTPSALCERAWNTFKNRNFVRVLEPSAGDGHLLKHCPHHRWRKIPIDCIELDISKHQTLRTQGFEVVGMDFMQFKSGCIYSQIIMNPPFADGVKHVLKAWDILYDGEIVAIINAESLKNPFSKQRKQLLSLIEQFGEVEYLQAMFAGEDSERKTHVEIALVWLKKSSGFEADILGTILDELRQDQTTEASLVSDYVPIHPLALPDSFIENAVLMFNAAIESAKQAIHSEARARRYSRMLGGTLGQLNGDIADTSEDASVDWVKAEIYQRYTTIKNKAWAGILRSTQVTSRVSSSAQKRLEAEFELIKALEFNVSNIYGFLQGILDQQAEIKLAMTCDVFDLITRYYSDNTVYYLGWKSNDKHRTLGMRIKTTRFVIPGHKTETYYTELPWGSVRLLADFDKVFAMLDGKQVPEISLESIFRQHFKALCNGNRLSASYFDVRYYPKIGTIHFFPTNKTLVDRINRIVGRHRRWLPPVDSQAGHAFWQHYDQAEKIDKAFQNAVKTQQRSNTNQLMRDPFWLIKHGEESEQEKAHNLLTQTMTQVLVENGSHIDELLAASSAQYQDCLQLEQL